MVILCQTVSFIIYLLSSFWKNVLCNVEENSNCWLSKCEICKNVGKFIPLKLMGSITNNGKVWFTTKLIQMMRMTPPSKVIPFSRFILDTIWK